MHPGALSKKVLETRTSFSGKFDKSPCEILKSLEAEEGKPDVIGSPLEVLSLQDICNTSPSSPLRSRLGTQFFLRIGTWKDETWTINLVMLLAPANPLAPIEDWKPHIMLFVERTFDSAESNILVHFDSKVDVYLMDKRAKEKGLPSGTKPWSTFSHLFTNEDNVQVLSPHYHKFKYLMRLFDGRGSTESDIVFEITCSERIQNAVHANPGLLQLDDTRNMILRELDLASIQNLEAGLHKMPRPPGMQSEKIAMERFRIALIRYFPEPSAFAAIMLQTGAIIGGSTALSIVGGGTWVPGDLDLIVTEQYFNRLRDYLVHQGFVLDSTASREAAAEYDPDLRLCRFAYRCFTKGVLKIDVSVCFFRCDQMTPADFILTYHMSFVMNFVSGEGVYSLFPTETFRGKGFRNKFTLEERLERILTKYAARGYTEILLEDETYGMDRPVYLQERFAGSRGDQIMIKDIKIPWSMKLPLSTKENRRS